MILLLIDTSRPEAWVAVAENREIVAARSWAADKTLGIQLLEAIDGLVEEAELTLADLDRIAVHRGPGHFSALRTGIVTAQLLADQLGCDLVEIAGDSRHTGVAHALEAAPVLVVKPQYGE